ncbi:MAG: L-aspartate oxidase [Nitrospinota bacterium]
MWKSTKADLIVVGSGIAGLTFSLLASRSRRVLMVTKSELGAGNSLWAQGGIAAPIGADDEPRLHKEDTLKTGMGLCDSDAVDTLVNEGALAIRFLEELGVAFDKNGRGGVSLGREGAHSRNRIVHSGGDATGINVIETLLFHAKRNPNITMVQHAEVIDLLVSKGECRGVVALAGGGRPHIFYGSAVVLSSGGLGHLYSYTTNTEGANGEGYAMAWRAGAHLRDMEFVQFHPTALKVNRNPLPLISEAVRGEGAFLVNGLGERLMEKAHPLKDLAPRDAVSRAIFLEIERDTKNSGEVFLDATGIERFEERFPTIFSSCKREGLDPRRDLIPVVPAAHYEMGGVETDVYGKTSLPGLLALGEAGSTGVHGANRLASNSLLEALVFSQKAALALPEALPEIVEKKGVEGVLPEYSCEKFVQSNMAHDPAFNLKVQKLLWEHAGIMRDGKGLQTALKQIEKWASEEEDEDEAVPTRKLNLLTTAKLVIEGALWRKESRGAHFRTDFPEPLEKYRVHSLQENIYGHGGTGSVAQTGSL